MCKKILHLTHTDITSDSRILKEMEALHSMGNKLRGVGLRDRGQQQITWDDGKFSLRAVVIYSRAWRFLPTKIRWILNLFELYLAILWEVIRYRPDIIHCHDIVVLPIGFFSKILVRCKLVYDAHELESNKNGQSINQMRLIYGTEKILWNFIDGLIVVSPSINSWYQAEFGEKTSAIIFNSPYIERSAVIKNDYLRKKFSIAFDKKIFIYVGVIGRGRGIELLIECFDKPEMNSHLVFLGYGEMYEEIRELSLTKENIHLHDKVSHKEVVSIVMSADFGICMIENISLSDYFCLPNKLFEYIFSGVPVIASNFPDMRQIVEFHDVGICADVSASSITQSVKFLEKNQREFQFKNLGVLDWSSQEEKLRTLYEKIM